MHTIAHVLIERTNFFEIISSNFQNVILDHLENNTNSKMELAFRRRYSYRPKQKQNNLQKTPISEENEELHSFTVPKKKKTCYTLERFV